MVTLYWPAYVCERGGDCMKPLIGITAGQHKGTTHILKDTYVQAVIRAGGIPVIVPIGNEPNCAQLIEPFDGFIFSGGEDVDPTLFGEEPARGLGEVAPARDAFEMAFAKAAIQSNKPILGICRGMQLLNVALGGSLYQDIETQKEGTIRQHDQKAPPSHPSHFVQLTEGSYLQKIFTKETIKVNSFHHQAVKQMGASLKIGGVASDGVIEAFESTEHPFFVGVQWHPEALLEKEDEGSLQLFQAFIQKCHKGRD